VTKATVWVPEKVCFEKHCNLCKKHGGAYTMHNTRECQRFEKDKKEKPNYRTAKKGGNKGNLVNHNFAQLTKKIEKLKKALKNSGKKGKKRCNESPPSPMKATPTTIASDSNDVSTASVARLVTS
jgi:hypothetical protein